MKEENENKKEIIHFISFQPLQYENSTDLEPEVPDIPPFIFLHGPRMKGMYISLMIKV